MTRSTMIGVLVGLLCSCSSAPPHASSHDAVESAAPRDARPDDVLLVADNQFHNLYGDPHIYGSSTADQAVSVSVRPPYLDLFAPDLLRDILSANPDRLVLHLGDALNISSDAEWATFVEVMDGRRWFMTPGNHDVYYSGLGGGDVEPGEPIGGRKEWSAAADTRGNGTFEPPRSLPLTKDRWIVAYLDEVGGPLLSTPPASPRGRWSNPDPNHPLRRVAWNLASGDDYWTSWLAQEIRLDVGDGAPLHVYLLDTCDYDERPTPASWLAKKFWTSKVNAGLRGEVGSEQLAEVTAWIDDRGGDFLLAGHHPVGDLTSRSRDRLGELLAGRRDGYRGFVTAHTHGPHEYDELDPAWGESNIGSTTDHPIQYALLRRSDGSVQRVTDVESTILARVATLGPTWSADIDYADYRPSRIKGLFRPKASTQRRVLQLLQEAYVRMFDELGGLTAEEAVLVERARSVGRPDRAEPKKGRWSVVESVDLLKELAAIDARKTAEGRGEWRHRRLYGAWHAVRAARAEAGL